MPEQDNQSKQLDELFQKKSALTMQAAAIDAGVSAYAGGPSGEPLTDNLRNEISGIDHDIQTLRITQEGLDAGLRSAVQNIQKKTDATLPSPDPNQKDNVEATQERSFMQQGVYDLFMAHKNRALEDMTVEDIKTIAKLFREFNTKERMEKALAIAQIAYEEGNWNNLIMNQPVQKYMEAYLAKTP